jgi:hypothetical protein
LRVKWEHLLQEAGFWRVSVARPGPSVPEKFRDAGNFG